MTAGLLAMTCRLFTSAVRSCSFARPCGVTCRFRTFQHALTRVDRHAAALGTAHSAVPHVTRATHRSGEMHHLTFLKRQRHLVGTANLVPLPVQVKRRLGKVPHSNAACWFYIIGPGRRYWYHSPYPPHT